MNPEIPPSSILEQELLKRNQQLEEKVARLEKENRILRELRRLDLIKKYGPGSESLSLEQLELLEAAVGVAGVDSDSDDIARMNLLRIKRFQRLVRDDRISVLGGRRGGQDK